MIELFIELALPSLVIFYAWKKKALNTSGTFSGLPVGIITCLCGPLHSIILFFFFITSSLWTKFMSKLKLDREDGYMPGAGNRN